MDGWFEKIEPHVNHKIKCVSYEFGPEDLEGVAIECEDCDVVIVDGEKRGEDGSSK